MKRFTVIPRVPMALHKAWEWKQYIFGLGALSAFGLTMPMVTAHSVSAHRLTPDYWIQDQYHYAVDDASILQPGENVDTLLPITPENPHLIWNEDYTQILVVTWKRQSSYERHIRPHTLTSDQENHVIWVTAAPEIQDFCREYLATHPEATQEELELRLKQHLGLHYDWTYDVFVELWVSPDQLFRPCVDPDITDTQCNEHFGDRIPEVANIADYRSFYTHLYWQSFRTLPGTPWTGLGYTYDWGNPVSEVGVSEFIIAPSTPYTIHQVQPTREYCSVPQT
ncbi:MAG: hypothetical protein F6K16_41865 [Symploca sp. SIO2B6]|nr:hypothetical protein [Symploca sp. SIO2B6]